MTGFAESDVEEAGSGELGEIYVGTESESQATAWPELKEVRIAAKKYQTH
jgi:hypothetical protein